jgi:hypothetical protein
LLKAYPSGFEVSLNQRGYRVAVDLSRFLRQPVKTQSPSNGELSHGIVS